MRNPLSAIVQCADVRLVLNHLACAYSFRQSIIAAHKDFEHSADYREVYRNVFDTAIDAAATIVQCSKHMKTIVDGQWPLTHVCVFEMIMG
jgi:hypothetical protein